MFPDRLKERRKILKKTQNDMAQELGVSARTIYMWESGERKPDIETLASLARYLGVTTDYLLGLTDDPQFEQPETVAARPTAGMPPISEERLNEIIAEAVRLIREEAKRPKKEK